MDDFQKDYNSSKFSKVIQTLPKTDMHLHIEGSISLNEYAEVVPLT